MSSGKTWALFLGFLWRFTLASGVVALLCAAQLAARLKAYDRAKERERTARIEAVTDASERLARGFATDLARIRTQALDLRATQSVRGALGNGLLHWAELYADDAHVLGVRRSLPGTAALSASHEAYYLAAASAKIAPDLRKIRSEGLGLLRVEDPEATGRERLVFIFPLALPETNLVLAMVDPDGAFPALTAWHGSSGLRMYLADRDGKVLLHSEKNYAGASLGDVDSYKRLALRAQGSGTVTIARATSSDALTVTEAATHPLGLSLLLAVEQPLPIEGTWLGFPLRTRFYAFWIALGLLGVFWCGVGTGLWIWWDRRKSSTIARRPLPRVREAVAAKVAEEVPLEETPEPLPTREIPASVPAAFPEAFEAALVESAFRQKLLGEVPLPEESAPEPDPEPAPKVLTPEEQAENERRERSFIEEQLMDRYEDALIHEREPRKIAYLLTEFAQRLCEAPAVFFGFHSGLRSAILLHACALPPQSKRLVSFPLSDACLTDIGRAEREGRVASLDAYLPIRDLLKLTYRISDFRAWALTGISRAGVQGDTHSNLLGILVVFRATREPGVLIEQAIRSTGPLYEKNLHASPNA